MYHKQQISLKDKLQHVKICYYADMDDIKARKFIGPYIKLWSPNGGYVSCTPLLDNISGVFISSATEQEYKTELENNNINDMGFITTSYDSYESEMLKLISDNKLFYNFFVLNFVIISIETNKTYKTYNKKMNSYLVDLELFYVLYHHKHVIAKNIIIPWQCNFYNYDPIFQNFVYAFANNFIPIFEGNMIINIFSSMYDWPAYTRHYPTLIGYIKKDRFLISALKKKSHNYARKLILDFINSIRTTNKHIVCGDLLQIIWKYSFISIDIERCIEFKSNACYDHVTFERFEQFWSKV